MLFLLNHLNFHFGLIADAIVGLEVIDTVGDEDPEL